MNLLDFLKTIPMMLPALRGRLSREFLLTSLVGAVALGAAFYCFFLSPLPCIPEAFL